MKIGEFIQKHMNKMQMSQAELARQSGVPASTISSIIIRNNDRVAIEMMLKLCEVLECDIEEYVNSLKKEHTEQMPESFARKYYSLDEYGKKAVDSILNVEYERCNPNEDNQTIKVFRAARSTDNHDSEIVEMSAERLQKLKDAPKTGKKL